MTIKGAVKNGVVIPDEGVILVEGDRVDMVMPGEPPLSPEYLKFAGTLNGPKDFARNHDHYIHGTPKK